MKKKFISLSLIIFSLFHVYSFEEGTFSGWTKEKLKNEDADFFDTEQTAIYKLEDNLYACLSEFSLFYITDNSSMIKDIDIACCTTKDYGQKKNEQLSSFQLGDFHTYIFDADYDEELDVLNYAVSGMGVSIELKNLHNDLCLFETDISSYSDSLLTETDKYNIGLIQKYEIK